MKIRTFRKTCALALCLAATLGGPRQRAQTALPDLSQRIESVWGKYDDSQFAATIAAADSLLAAFDFRQKPAEQADLFSAKANALADLGFPKQALALQRQCLARREEAFGPASQPVANACQNIGLLLLELGDPAAAEPFLRRCLRLNQQLQNAYQLPSALAAWGNFLRMSVQFSAAKTHIEQAIRLEPPGSPNLFHRRHALAALFLDMKMPDRAAAVLAPMLENEAVPARKIVLLRTLADGLHADGQFEAAAARFSEALRLLAAQPNASVSAKTDCLLGLADALLEFGDFEAAARHCRAALALPDERPLPRARALLGLGRAQRYLGEPDEARQSLSDAADLLRETPAAPEVAAMLDAVRSNQGSCFLELGDRETALLYFEKALASQTASPRPDKALLVGLLHKIGGLRREAGQFADAENLHRRAQNLAVELRDAGLLFATDYSLGQLALAQKQAARAVEFFEKARAQVSGGFPFEALQAAVALSAAQKLVARQSGSRTDWQAALRRAEESIGQLETLRASLFEGQSQAVLQDIFHQPYGVAVEASLALGESVRAFQWAERQKSFFLNRLAKQAFLHKPTAFSQKMAALERRLAALERQRFEANSRRENNPKTARLDAEIQSVAAALRQSQDSARQRDPAFAALFSPEKTAAADVPSIARSLRPDQSLLEYVWAEDLLFAFVLRPEGSLSSKSLPLAPGLAGEIERFFHLCSFPPTWAKPAEKQARNAELVRLGHALHGQLLAPLAPLFGRDSNLVIVPDGALCYLPFGALIRQPGTKPHQFGGHDWLARHSEIQYRPLAQLPPRAGESPEKLKPLLAFAPVFGSETPDLPPLEHSADECADVQKILGTGDIRAGAAATEAAFAQAGDGYRVLHFSTHGVLDDRAPGRSFIAFAQRPDSLDDGRFYVPEIYSHALRADLVTLSACETARGKFHWGEGLASVARAFQMAGARNVVASLWLADEQQIRAEMAVFYENIAAGQPISAALAAAQRRHLDKHPFYWAGLVSSGDDAPVGLPNAGFWLWASGLAAAILAGLGAWFWRKRRRRRGGF